MKHFLPAQLFALAILCALPGCGENAEPPPLLEDRDDKPLAFANPDTCEECHEQHVAEWRISNHAYALKDPVFLAMVEVGQKQSEGKLGQFCIQCHSPVALATEQTPVFPDPETGIYRQPFDDVDAIGQQGVSCDVCHSITNVLEPFNARVVYTPDGVRRGTIRDPVTNKEHESAYSELHATADVCSPCHAVVNPKGALIEETFGEWEMSSAAAEGKTCQDCHMPEYTGRAAPDAPERTLHRHTFVGVDVSLLPEDEFPGFQEMRDLTAEMLRSSVEFSAQANIADRDNPRIELEIRNLAGHAVPSGATAERQMWVELMVRNADGDVVFETGTLDDNGDLRDGVADHSLDPGSDPQLVYYGQQLIAIPGFTDLPDDAAKDTARVAVDDACRPMSQGAIDPASNALPVSFPWQADWQCNFMIPPDAVDRPFYELGALPAGSYSATVKLQFRTFPPYFLRKLEELAGLDPAVKDRVPIVLMAQDELTFDLPAEPSL